MQQIVFHHTWPLLELKQKICNWDARKLLIICFRSFSPVPYVKMKTNAARKQNRKASNYCITKWDKRNLSNTNLMWISTHLFTGGTGKMGERSSKPCPTQQIQPSPFIYISAKSSLHKFFYILCILCLLINLNFTSIGSNS